MNSELLENLREAHENRRACVLVTVAATRGSVPREAGAKMLVYADGKAIGTVGGGKFESLVIADSLAALPAGAPVLKVYPLHESGAESFGAICGGEVTVLIEPISPPAALVLVGAGHCSRAIAKLARECGFHVTVLDDRADMLTELEHADQKVSDRAPADFIHAHQWRAVDALVIVSRNFEIDRRALDAALKNPGMGYIGMIGSRRKVQRVFDELKAGGVEAESLAQIYSPIGLDIGADSPVEIAVSVLAEVLQVLRGRSGEHLRARVPS